MATVDSLRQAWQRVIDDGPPENFAEARRRTLRRHAIETGVIERLYDVDWAVTQALVAEGLSLDAATHVGGVDEGALMIIQSHFASLEFLVEAARLERPLSTWFIRNLHSSLCRTQPAFTAQSPQGVVIERPLALGEWKKLSNQAIEANGSWCPSPHPSMLHPRLIGC